MSVGAGLSGEEQAALEAARRDPRCHLDRYLLLRELGRGGIGVVYQAYDPHTERLVAIKRLLSLPQGPRLQRFLREARLAGQLQHPAIPRQFAVVSEGPNAPYLVMEHLRGEPLDVAWRRERPSAERLREVIRGVAEALACAHERGIVHRDLKPSNVLLSAEGQPKLLDFGLDATTSSAS